MRLPSFSALEIFVLRLILLILLLLAGYRLIRDDFKHTFAAEKARRHELTRNETAAGLPP